MLGDWVRTKAVEGALRVEAMFPREVNRPERYSIALIGKNNTVLYTYGECVDPIPLTREILEQNGWSEDYNAETDILGHHFPEDKNLNLELYISDVDETVVWTLNCHEYGVIPLRYVHELQHALRLCGIEKEVVL